MGNVGGIRSIPRLRVWQAEEMVGEGFVVAACTRGKRAPRDEGAVGLGDDEFPRATG